jgi:2-dehydropantoate 2-reductase
MRVAIFGAGAVGSVLGALLSRKNDVVLIGRPAHVRAIKRAGLRLEGTTRGRFAVEATTSPAAVADADLVFLSVKSFDTPAAAVALRRARLKAPLVTLQNGLTNIAVLAKRLPGTPLVGGSLVLGALFVAPGRVRHTGAGRAIVGRVAGRPSPAAAVARLLRDAGVPTTVTGDLQSVLWQKAIVNAAVNPLTALLRCRNAELLERPEAMLLAQLAAEEATQVARAARIRVKRDPWPGIVQILRETSENRTSMLQDVEAGRQTEIEAITGEIVRVAHARRVPVPVNEALLRLVRSL